MLQLRTTWAEDRALLRSNPSADPGAKTEGRVVRNVPAAATRLSCLRDWHVCDKPSRQDAATISAGCGRDSGENFAGLLVHVQVASNSDFSWPTAQTNPANSRAMAVTVFCIFLPA